VRDVGRGIDQIWRDYFRKGTDLQLAVLAALIVPVILVFAWSALRESPVPVWWPAILVPLLLQHSNYGESVIRELTIAALNRFASDLPARSLRHTRPLRTENATGESTSAQ